MWFNSRVNTTMHIIDSPRRDIIWRLSLARQLQCNGIASYIGRADAINFISQYLIGGVLCGRLGGTSGRSEFDRRMIARLKKLDGKIFYIHDEGGAFRESDYERETKLFYPSELFSDSVFERIYFWGRKQKAVFEGQSWLSKSMVVGAPRFDAHKRSMSYAQQTGDKVYMALQPYVLVNSRFSNVLTSGDDVGSLSKRMFDIRVEGGDRKFKTDREIVEAMYSRWSSSAHDYVEFITMLVKVCLDNPNVSFILRPHPAEDDSWYLNNLSLIPNVTVLKHGDVQAAIEHSQIVIGSDCTTGLEALLLGKQYINYIPFPEKGENNIGLSEIGSLAHDATQVSGLVTQAIAGEQLPATTLSVFDESIDNVSKNTSALQHIASDIIEYFKSREPSPSGRVRIRTMLSTVSIKHLVKSVMSFFGAGQQQGDKFVWPSKKEIYAAWEGVGGDPSDLRFGHNYISVKARRCD